MALTINRSALVMHSAERMNAIINDVAAYPEFLPWCSKTVVLEQTQEFMIASIEVRKGAVKQTFTTRNDISTEGRVLMGLVDGPFTHLQGVWDLKHLKDDACKISLTLDFELKRNLTKVAFGAVFNQAANSMVDAFCKRATQVYG